MTHTYQYGLYITSFSLFLGLPAVPDAVLKLMGAYLVFAFTGFVMILVFLEKIGAKADSEKPCLLVWYILKTNMLVFVKLY